MPHPFLLIPSHPFSLLNPSHPLPHLHFFHFHSRLQLAIHLYTLLPSKPSKPSLVNPPSVSGRWTPSTGPGTQERSWHSRSSRSPSSSSSCRCCRSKRSRRRRSRHHCRIHTVMKTIRTRTRTVSIMAVTVGPSVGEKRGLVSGSLLVVARRDCEGCCCCC